MNFEKIASLLGKESGSEDIIACLRYFGATKAPKLKKSEDTAYIQIPKNGIDFAFRDEAVVKELKYQDIGEGPLLLITVFFYEKYNGTLPNGLSFNDGREKVQNKLGQSVRWNERFLSETWHFDNYRMIVYYSDTLQSINRITIGLIPKE